MAETTEALCTSTEGMKSGLGARGLANRESLGTLLSFDSRSVKV
jgi:hypothetical protein